MFWINVILSVYVAICWIIGVIAIFNRNSAEFRGKVRLRHGAMYYPVLFLFVFTLPISLLTGDAKMSVTITVREPGDD